MEDFRLGIAAHEFVEIVGMNTTALLNSHPRQFRSS